MIKSEDVIIPSANAVFREEFDDWGLLFDPDTGEVFGVNPVGAFIWKHLDGRKSVTEIASLVTTAFEKVPESVDQDALAFVEKLKAKGFLGSEAS